MIGLEYPAYFMLTWCTRILIHNCGRILGSREAPFAPRSHHPRSKSTTYLSSTWPLFGSLEKKILIPIRPCTAKMCYGGRSVAGSAIATPPKLITKPSSGNPTADATFRRITSGVSSSPSSTVSFTPFHPLIVKSIVAFCVSRGFPLLLSCGDVDVEKMCGKKQHITSALLFSLTHSYGATMGTHSKKKTQIMKEVRKSTAQRTLFPHQDTWSPRRKVKLPLNIHTHTLFLWPFFLQTVYNSFTSCRRAPSRPLGTLSGVGAATAGCPPLPPRAHATARCAPLRCPQA